MQVGRMKIRSLMGLAVVAVCVTGIATLGPWDPSLFDDAETSAGTDPASARSTITAAEAGVTADEPADEPAVSRIVDLAWRAPTTPSPRYASPDEIERQIEQFFAEQSGLALVTLSSIDCGATACEIALAGTVVNPRTADSFSGVFQRLFARRDAFRILSGGLGTREIAPGAREYVISFEYQPFVDSSPDPLIAARQYAACAAAWRRQTENPTPTDVARQYLGVADRYVALAASVLGEDEAARVAAETRGGPLIRECGL
jgi:hypothetical protein